MRSVIPEAIKDVGELVLEAIGDTATVVIRKLDYACIDSSPEYINAAHCIYEGLVSFILDMHLKHVLVWSELISSYKYVYEEKDGWRSLGMALTKNVHGMEDSIAVISTTLFTVYSLVTLLP